MSGLDGWMDWIGWISLNRLTTRSPYGDNKTIFHINFALFWQYLHKFIDLNKTFFWISPFHSLVQCGFHVFNWKPMSLSEKWMKDLYFRFSWIFVINLFDKYCPKIQVHSYQWQDTLISLLPRCVWRFHMVSQIIRLYELVPRFWSFSRVI